jgi:hypothetical protein
MIIINSKNAEYILLTQLVFIKCPLYAMPILGTSLAVDKIDKNPKS